MVLTHGEHMSLEWRVLQWRPVPNWTHAILNLPICSSFEIWRVIEGIRVNICKNCVPLHKGNLGTSGEHTLIVFFGSIVYSARRDQLGSRFVFRRAKLWLPPSWMCRITLCFIMSSHMHGFTWGIEVCILFYNTKCTSVSCPTTLIFHHSHLFLSSPDFGQWHQVCHRGYIRFWTCVKYVPKQSIA